MTVPMMPMVGAKPPAFSKTLPATLWRLDMASVSISRISATMSGSVPSTIELQALLDVLVVDLRDLVVEGQQAVAAGALGAGRRAAGRAR